DGPEKKVLTDKAAVHALMGHEHGAEAIGAMARGNLPAGLKALDGKNPPELIHALVKEPKLGGLDKLGITESDLAHSRKGLSALVGAAQQAHAGHDEDAITTLATAPKEAHAAAAKAIGHAAHDLPAGPARDLLQNPRAVSAILDSKK